MFFTIVNRHNRPVMDGNKPLLFTELDKAEEMLEHLNKGKLFNRFAIKLI